MTPNKSVQKWSLAYAILRPWVQLAFRSAHKEIKVIGKENIPVGCPVIFAPNHQNALEDALTLVYSAPGQTVFLARADIFKNRIVAHLLHFLKILPVYRIRDGKESLDQNEEIFNLSVDLLIKKKSLCLFPEAAHTASRSMLPHRKAIPRIVFRAGEKTGYQLDIQIVPVGITYDHYYRFRRSMVIWYGQPISVKPFYQLALDQDERTASIALRDKIFYQLEQLIIHIPDKNEVEWFEQLFLLLRPAQNKKRKLERGIYFNLLSDKAILLTLLSRSKQVPEEWEQIKIKLDELKRIKTCNLLPGYNLSASNKPSHGLLSLVFLTMVISPFMLSGICLNGWLFALTRYSFRKKIKDHQFWSSFSFGLSLLGYTLWYLILLITFSLLSGHPGLSFLLIVCIHFSGIVTWELFCQWENWKLNAIWTQFKRKKPDQANRIAALEQEISIYLTTHFKS